MATAGGTKSVRSREKGGEKKYENEEKQRLKAEKRSVPSFGGGGGGGRSRMRAPAGSYAAKWGGISSASQRRSEIDVAMDDLRNSRALSTKKRVSNRFKCSTWRTQWTKKASRKFPREIWDYF